MKILKLSGRAARGLAFLFFCLSMCHAFAQPTPPGGSGGGRPTQFNFWPFADTNWLTSEGYAPVNFTNIFNEPDGDNTCLWLDTTNTIPAFIFYNIVETNGFTNLITTNGTISLWFSPDWSSTNQGGTGPGDWGNIISMGQAGTNGSSWWAWYFSPDGGTVYFSSQTNGGCASNYLAAPVSLSAGNWYNLVLTYSLTNSAFYTNGFLVTNGNGVAYWPGPDVTFFAIGSDTNGFYQAGGEFDDMATYNYPMDTNSVAGFFGIYSIFFGLVGSGPAGQVIVGAPSTNTVLPTFDAVTGAGFLQSLGTSATYPTSSNVWITNWSATLTGSNVMNVNFAVAGGSNGVPYDVFATGVLLYPITNSTWFWMGQAYRGTNYALPITNYPLANVFLILGKPTDTDQDGLTDAYELLVSHTNPNSPSTANDGILDGWAVVWGLNPLVDPSSQSSERSNFTYDPVGRLDSLFGIRNESLTNDFEGNVLTAQ